MVQHTAAATAAITAVQAMTKGVGTPGHAARVCRPATSMTKVIPNPRTCPPPIAAAIRAPAQTTNTGMTSTQQAPSTIQPGVEADAVTGWRGPRTRLTARPRGPPGGAGRIGPGQPPAAAGSPQAPWASLPRGPGRPGSSPTRGYWPATSRPGAVRDHGPGELRKARGSMHAAAPWPCAYPGNPVRASCHRLQGAAARRFLHGPDAPVRVRTVIRRPGGLDLQLGEQFAADIAQRLVTLVVSPVVRPGEPAVQFLSHAGRQALEHARRHLGDLTVCVAHRIAGPGESVPRPGQCLARARGAQVPGVPVADTAGGDPQDALAGHVAAVARAVRVRLVVGPSRFQVAGGRRLDRRCHGVPLSRQPGSAVPFARTAWPVVGASPGAPRRPQPCPGSMWCWHPPAQARARAGITATSPDRPVRRLR